MTTAKPKTKISSVDILSQQTPMGRESVDDATLRRSRDQRAKEAKDFINKAIPVILRASQRARKGVESSELIVDPPPVSPPPKKPAWTRPENRKEIGGDEGLSNAIADEEIVENRKPQITVRVVDTLEAVAHLCTPEPTSPHHRPRVAALNMASPLRPGGGVLSGATSQEEWLCARTTLYPSLREEFYRLPEVGGVYTPDVLVVRKWDEAATEIEKKDWVFVDIVTAAMLRFPDLDKDGVEARYAEEKDRELVVKKMRAVMRILQAKGAEKIVLGAWGCGAYGNPVNEVAKAWKKVLLGGKAKKRAIDVDEFGTGREAWDELDVVFAIKDARMAEAFVRAFGPGLAMEELANVDQRSTLQD
jgi:uncharacterized protein (TIGR02452 family)